MQLTPEHWVPALVLDATLSHWYWIGFVIMCAVSPYIGSVIFFRTERKLRKPTFILLLTLTCLPVSFCTVLNLMQLCIPFFNLEQTAVSLHSVLSALLPLAVTLLEAAAQCLILATRKEIHSHESD